MARAVMKPSKNVPFFLKKITPKFVTEAVALDDPESPFGVNLLALPRPVEPRMLYELYGQIRKAVVVPDKSGTKKDSVRFTGALKAYTPPDENGEQYIFESGQTFIPVVDDILYSTLMSAQQSEPGAYLEIAFAVAIRAADPTKPSMTGYEWDVQKLITQAPKPDDPIERLRQEAKAQRLALAAPKKEPTPDPTSTSIATGTTVSSDGNGSSATSPETSQLSTDSSAGSVHEPEHKSRRGKHAST